MLTTIEKVIILQGVDVFEDVPTEGLAHIASIAEVFDYPENTDIFKEYGRADSMYLVLEGSVVLRQGEKEVMVAKEKEAFGTWALFDDEPRIVTATTREPVKLLRIDEEDFLDLLADDVRITRGVLKSLVKRVRGLMALAARKQG